MSNPKPASAPILTEEERRTVIDIPKISQGRTMAIFAGILIFLMVMRIQAITNQRINYGVKYVDNGHISFANFG